MTTRSDGSVDTGTVRVEGRTAMGEKITISNLKLDLYAQVRIAAFQHNCTVADIINDVLEEWFGDGEAQEDDGI